jgi:hypothetical protein
VACKKSETYLLLACEFGVKLSTALPSDKQVLQNSVLRVATFPDVLDGEPRLLYNPFPQLERWTGKMQPADPAVLYAWSAPFYRTLEIKSALKNQCLNIIQSPEASLSIDKRFLSACEHQ